jgi:hypothetical protein
MLQVAAASKAADSRWVQDLQLPLHAPASSGVSLLLLMHVTM